MHEALDVGKLTSEPMFNARNVSLCSQSFGGAVKSTHRIGTFKFCAKLIQTALVSRSALVLSGNISLPRSSAGQLGFRVFLPTTTLVPSWMSAVAVLRHFSRCFNMLPNAQKVAHHVQACASTYSLEDVLIHSSVTEGLQMFPIKG